MITKINDSFFSNKLGVQYNIQRKNYVLSAGAKNVMNNTKKKLKNKKVYVRIK